MIVLKPSICDGCCRLHAKISLSKNHTFFHYCSLYRHKWQPFVHLYSICVLHVNTEWPGIMGRHSDQSCICTGFAVTLAFSLIRTRLRFCLFLEGKTNCIGVRAWHDARGVSVLDDVTYRHPPHDHRWAHYSRDSRQLLDGTRADRSSAVSHGSCFHETRQGIQVWIVHSGASRDARWGVGPLSPAPHVSPR